MIEINQRLKMFRESKRITQEEMAKYVGTSKNHLSAIERGINKVNASILITYADKCGISLDELVGRNGDNEIIPELRQLLSTMDKMQQAKVFELVKLLES